MMVHNGSHIKTYTPYFNSLNQTQPDMTNLRTKLTFKIIKIPNFQHITHSPKPYMHPQSKEKDHSRGQPIESLNQSSPTYD